ncbi:MAG: CO dehydrogenase/CO-methylating acetyl-CoA synthase complex subunit beta [Spirochaetes bacterium]|nr:MAG: CO dehydrogenase/CO-methylating acetyl-CoA synthase complex subunit beta [Spirochaetota bacterium]
MSKLICASAIDGAVEWVARAEQMLDRAMAEKGEGADTGFPDTAYYLPVIYSFTGEKMETVADLRRLLRYAKSLLPARPAEHVWLPYLGNTLDAGVAALFACEIIEACKYLAGPSPVNGIWLGAANDIIMRERGIEFVDGTAPGFAAITGAAPTNAIAVRIARELQEKNLYVFMAGSTNGKQFAEQLHEEGVQLGWETRLVPFGPDVSALIYALGFANRAALSFGGVKPGDFRANLRYNKDRIFAFVLAMGEVDSAKYAAAAGALNYGFPVIADTDIPQILPSGITTYEHVVSNVPPETMVEKALEVRGCKIRITKVPIPVPYGAAFEGERIRKQDTHVEFGGNITTAFEFVTTVGLEDINDGEIEIVGKDVDDIEPGSALPLAIWVEVAGRKMQPDFESILERQIHHLVNGAEGIWHMGQRDIVWTRISKNGFGKGLRLKDYGEILHAKFLANYPAIVDKVKVTLFTDAAEVERRIAVARKIYQERNRRLESMTDESVDTFYSCLLCQSFAPNHVCVITPERLGLCGAYNWLDGKAAHEIDETGPNQPVRKGECMDPVRGVWSGVNEYVYANSHKSVESFCLYSIMERPMTSCGCFEVILAYLPEANGVMAVNREYTGETPVGMSFSTLAGNVGGGAQTPGFMGCGKVFLTSRKFLYAEGGHRRLVWMTKELKELLADDLNRRFGEQGAPGLLDMIADESIAIEAREVRAFMEKAGHPALSMEDMANVAEGGDPSPAQAAPAPSGKQALREIPAAPESVVEAPQASGPAIPGTLDIAALKEEIMSQVRAEIKESLTREIVTDIIGVLSGKFLDGAELVRHRGATGHTGTGKARDAHTPQKAPAVKPAAPRAAERIGAIKSFAVRKDRVEIPVHAITLGATRAEGGTRGRTLTIGGAPSMPFHGWEGSAPHRPLVAMEVFDRVSEKYPPVLRAMWGGLLARPAEMARACVEKYGADVISVRLDGTHPERGNRAAADSLAFVKEVLAAVDVPLIVTGHNHYEKNNEVMKEIARGCAGENLLLNWVEQDNYRTIAGAALAYGHTLVAQSPIDVNIAKQLCILLGNMGIPANRIVIDPMTGAMGYGIEYTYSVMERIRLTGLGGDAALAAPMIVSPGQECAKIKELRASGADFPEWGELEKRAAVWELSTATALLYAGADILIMYNPESAAALRRTIDGLVEAR